VTAAAPFDAPKIQVISTEPCQVGECPVWSSSEQLLYWVDIEGRRIFQYDPATERIVTRAMPGRPGAIALSSMPGVLLVAMEHELVWFNWQMDKISSFVSLEPAALPNRLNDGRCDPGGRFITGSISETEPERTATASVYQVTSRPKTDPIVRQVQTGVTVTNGIAFDRERGRMYFADSPTRQIMVWDYDLSSGNTSNQRLFFDYGKIPGKPDGACVDAEGCYWSAAVNGHAVIRITPEGRLDRRIELPVERPSMPAFGGTGLTTLFVTSIGADAKPGGTVPAGSLIAIETDVVGVPEPVFAIG